MATRNIQVFIQAIRRYDATDLTHIHASSDLWPIQEITEMIPLGEIKDLSEKMENGRFAFMANDITIANIANNGWMHPAMPHCTNGCYVYIHYEGNEIYRGYASYIDFTFNDTPPMTFDIHSYNWLNLLKEQKTTNFQMERYTLDWYQAKMQALLFDTPARPFLTMPDKPNIDGIQDIGFECFCGTIKTDDNIATLPVIWDIWQNPITKRVFAVCAEAKSDMLHPVLAFYEMVCNKFIKLFNMKVWHDLEIRRENFSFLRNNTSLTRIGISYSIGGPSNRKQYFDYFKITWDAGDYVLGIGREVSHNVKKKYLIGEYGAERNFSREYDGCDGENFYIINDETGGMFSVSLTDEPRSSAILWTSAPFSAYNKSAIYFPHKLTVSYYEFPNLPDYIEGRFVDRNNSYWKWFKVGSSDIFTGSLLPPYREYTDMTLNGEYIFDWLFPPYFLNGFIFPTAYEEAFLNGRYAIWCSNFIPYVSDLARSEGWNWATNVGLFPYYKSNDPLFLAFSGFRYGEDEISLEDLFMDFAQAFNCYFFTRNGLIYLFERSHYADSYTFSTDYSDRDGYGRELSDESKEEPYLSFTTENLTDDDKHKFSKTTFCGALRIAYRDAFAVKWIRRTIKEPLPVGYACGLGDRITITETGESGTVIERKLDFDKGMAEFKFEVKL